MNQIWTRAEMKVRGKAAMMRNFWKCVVAALVLSLAAGSGSGSGGFTGGFSSGYNNATNEQYSYEIDGQQASEVEDMLKVMAPILVVVFLVVFAFALLISLFLLYPLEVGCRRFFLENRQQQAELGSLGFAFSNSYMNVVKVQFLRGLYVFLWSLLFIIPGIIKAYEYSMIPFILAENPGMDSKEAFRISKALTDGEKMNLFVLDLSFIGWHLLAALTCGILDLFFTNPYEYATQAEVYSFLRDRMFPPQYAEPQGYAQY